MQTLLRETPDPIVVITDSTELFNSYPLADTRWVLLANEISAGEVRWVVPEVVVRETVRHQVEAWDSAQKESLPAIQKAERALKQFGIRVPIDPAIVEQAAEKAANYESYLRARITELGGEVAALPTIEHDKLLAWDMLGRKPFAATGKGYRDALIWATVLEYVAAARPDNSVIFVSNNTRDFIGKDGIHSDLLEDTSALQPAAELLHSQGLTAAFTLVKDLRDSRSKSNVRRDQEVKGDGTAADSTPDETGSVKNHDADPSEPVEPPFEEPTVKLKDLLLSALEEQCSDLVGSALEEHTQGGDIYGPDWLSPEIENPSVYHLEPDPDSMTWDVVETFLDGTLLVNVVATAGLTVDGYMYKSAFYREEPRADVYALMADHNDHYAWVATEGYAQITFSILFSPAHKSANHTELISLETGAASFK